MAGANVSLKFSQSLSLPKGSLLELIQWRHSSLYILRLSEKKKHQTSGAFPVVVELLVSTTFDYKITLLHPSASEWKCYPWKAEEFSIKIHQLGLKGCMTGLTILCYFQVLFGSTESLFLSTALDTHTRNPSYGRWHLRTHHYPATQLWKSPYGCLEEFRRSFWSLQLPAQLSYHHRTPACELIMYQ